MLYLEVKPSAQITPFVECLWLLENTCINPAEELIFPDGRPELIIQYGDRPYEKDGGGWHQQRRSIFAGQQTRRLDLQPGRNSGMVGVRFRAAGATALLCCPMHNITDHIISLEDWNSAATREIEEKVQGAQDSSARLHHLMTWLEDQLTNKQVDYLSLAAIDHIRSAHFVGLEAVQHALGISERQLERRFRDHIGISAKKYMRTMRFQRALQRLDGDMLSPLTDMALDLGYYDQAHFNRDFRAFAGMSPSAYRKKQTAMNDLFTGPATH